MTNDSGGFEFTWREGHPAKGESLWSVIQKFCYLNATTESALFRHFRLANGRTAYVPALSYEHGKDGLVDLRFAGTLDIGALSRAIGVDSSWTQYATMDNWDSRSDARRNSVPFLRFCPVCIEAGFHTLIFQLSDERQCLVHRQMLEDSCPGCGRRIPYAGPVRGRAPYGCQCGYCLWSGLHSDDWATHRSNGDGVFPIQLLKRASGGVQTGASQWPHCATQGGDRCCPGKAIEPKIIKRMWPKRFAIERQSRRSPWSQYLLSGESYRVLYGTLYAPYRSLRRKLSGDNPAWMYRRWAQNAKFGTSLRSLANDGCPTSVIAMLIWRAYWEYRCDLRRLAVTIAAPKSTAADEYLRRSNLTWRFLQHAPLVIVRRCITSADCWMMAHALALVAVATYSTARLVAERMVEGFVAFSGNRCEALELVRPPSMQFAAKDRSINCYEIRIWPIETTVASGASSSLPHRPRTRK
jgi:hypothetical protein